MPRKLREFVHVLIATAIVIALLPIGLMFLPGKFGLLWLLLVIVGSAWMFHLMLGRPASDAKGNATHRLKRSYEHYWIAGVCGGIAEFLGWKPGVVRGLWMLGSLFTAIIGGVLIYTILAFVMPLPPDRGGKFRLEDFRVQ